MILRDLEARSQGRLRSDRRVPTILNSILNVKSPPSFDPPVVVGSWETRKRYPSLFFLFSFLLFFLFHSSVRSDERSTTASKAPNHSLRTTINSLVNLRERSTPLPRSLLKELLCKGTDIRSHESASRIRTRTYGNLHLLWKTEEERCAYRLLL